MNERQLEKVMVGFADGDFDVLVCTTIIESGLDIPNVNTIVIDRAGQLGLAQLYQLRGRGAGNILGAEQHGHVAAVGFELYTQLLQESFEELRGAPKAAELPEVVVDL